MYSISDPPGARQEWVSGGKVSSISLPFPLRERNPRMGQSGTKKQVGGHGCAVLMQD